MNDRYGPDSSAPPESKLELPASPDSIALGAPIDIYEPSKGWQKLQVSDKDTLKGKGIKDNAVLAFAFTEGDAETTLEEDVEFVVEWSSYDEQYGDEIDGVA